MLASSQHLDDSLPTQTLAPVETSSESISELKHWGRLVRKKSYFYFIIKKKNKFLCIRGPLKEPNLVHRFLYSHLFSGLF